jgi:hypothetical protein
MKKTIRIGNVRYIVENKDDIIFLVHMLAKMQYTPSEIAYILGISRDEVIEYLEDCW